MASISIMFVLGLLMQGRVYHPNGGDILDMLGFVGDVGAGGLYIVTRMQGWGHGAIAHATADYEYPDGGFWGPMYDGQRSRVSREW